MASFYIFQYFKHVRNPREEFLLEFFWSTLDNGKTRAFI
jgi:hypothetical protein